MSLDTDSPWAKIGLAILTAVIGGVGATVVDNKMTNIRQDERIAQFEDIKRQVTDLNQGLSEANTHLALFNLQYRNLQNDLAVVQKIQKESKSDGQSETSDGSSDGCSARGTC